MPARASQNTWEIAYLALDPLQVKNKWLHVALVYKPPIPDPNDAGVGANDGVGAKGSANLKRSVTPKSTSSLSTAAKGAGLDGSIKNRAGDGGSTGSSSELQTLGHLILPGSAVFKPQLLSFIPVNNEQVNTQTHP